MLLPLGTVAAIAAVGAIVEGPGARSHFPLPDDLPAVFRPYGRLETRGGNHGICLGCQVLMNVELAEQGEELLGKGPCYRRCGPAGLQDLTKRQQGRLQLASDLRRFTATELDFVRWPGLLDPAEAMTLWGLLGDARDAQLRLLMAA